MKKRTLKSLHLNKKLISNLKVEALKGQLGRGSDNPNCSGDTAMVYSCHPVTCNPQEQDR
ncbi:hypothetical protein [Kordia jejudonensis]|uniref:hypothetical protein n=1 Tax=Kordia jejudonensis TaxID=1348245 RepID=UPI000629A6B7|nr:hypothetical protein [Kordia jejudonensis]